MIWIIPAEGREKGMTQDEFNWFCSTLPHTSHVVQWGGADVWKVGCEDKSKLFAVGGWQKKSEAYGVTFKTGEIAFEMLRDAPGCQPAPYLASRRMKWIMRTGSESVTDTDMQDYLRESYRLASLNLTKKLQKQLGLNQEGAGDANITLHI